MLMLLLAVVLLFDLSMRVATYVVGEVTKPSRLVKSGVGADRLVCFARWLGLCAVSWMHRPSPRGCGAFPVPRQYTQCLSRP